jgi:hypothetical protein
MAFPQASYAEVCPIDLLSSSLHSDHTMCYAEWWLQPLVSSIPQTKWLQLYLPHRHQPAP